jgi:L-ascorbate metabolism protein UlaG (beta-lactamase superfamily)
VGQLRIGGFFAALAAQNETLKGLIARISGPHFFALTINLIFEANSKDSAMNIQLVRHATLRISLAGSTLLIDPILSPPGANPPVANTANEKRNPLVPLPIATAEVLRGVDAVLVTHTHRDHWDDDAAEAVPKHLPILCQPEDETKFRDWKFTDVRPIAVSIVWKKTVITRTGGRHGTGDIGKRMAPVSGFVLRTPGEPTLYIAGDTIWCDEVQSTLAAHSPDVIVVNAGEARFREGDPITMSAADVIATAQGAPSAAVIAVHLEAINHCGLPREGLRAQSRAAGLEHRILIPNDGETLEIAMPVSA